MSAIYGRINLKGNRVDASILDRFEAGYEDCKIERYDRGIRPEACMGIGLQCFNRESYVEAMPVIDEEHRLMFVADCVLDNRQELAESLGLDIENELIPDGSLAYRAYLTWGEEAVHHLRGMFAYVAYHYDSHKVHLQTDHFAGRCLHYYVGEDCLYFSTLLFPLIGAAEVKFQHNERWLVDAVSLRSPKIITEPEETACEGIKRIVAGEYVTVGNEGIQKHVYWNPQKLQTNWQMTAAECEQKVRSMMQESVANCIRTDGEVGVLLSSGLDSATVACIAAPMLEQRGSKLYSFTSVPLKEAKMPPSGTKLYDESEGVKYICGYYPAIEPTFVDYRGKNILNQSKEIVTEWQMPCKSQNNAVWLRECKHQAVEKGCKIMLTGATGNCTISAGSIQNYTRFLLSRGHFLQAYRAIGTFMHRYRGSRKRFIKLFLKLHLEYFTWYFKKGEKDMYANNITRREVGEKYDLTKRFRKMIHRFPTANMQGMREEIFMLDACAQIGSLETSSSLYTGILERDPMRNVEFIEFCMTIPMECFNNARYDRRLVREFMHDIVPPAIRLNVAYRGKQSADNEYRISLQWEDYLPRMEQELGRERVLRYLSAEKIREYIDRLDPENFSEQFIDMRMIVDAYLFALYLKELERIQKWKD